MLLTIKQLGQRIQDDLPELILDLQKQTGRFGKEEAIAWEISLGKLVEVFGGSELQKLQVFFGGKGTMALEYQLPGASSFCDVILLGAHQSRPAVVVIELKHWMTRNDHPGCYAGFIERDGAQELHPSEQVKGYTDFCRNFHSAVQDYQALVHGCVLFTRDPWIKNYREPPNDKLTEEYPIFTTATNDIKEAILGYFSERLSEPDEDFARAFVNGVYRQNRGFVAQIGNQIQNPETKFFELLDNQRKAFNYCSEIIQKLIQNGTDLIPPKKVIIIKGPPGSGKSVIAVNLWASLVTQSGLVDGDILFTTTSMSQNSNWSDLFTRKTKTEGAKGVVRKATTYTPITTQELGRYRKKHGESFCTDSIAWRKNLQTLKDLGITFRDGSRDNQNLVSIVDEAHALINPEHNEGRGQFGFAVTLGPQAYHIIRSSIVSIFLLDPIQGFRLRENTTLENLQEWSRELGAGDPVLISLDDTQFRCAGSIEYVAWIESVLNGNPPEINRELAKNWYSESGPSKSGKSHFDFRLFSNPETMESALRERIKEGKSARLLSTYSREWKTENSANPHSLAPNLMDFHEPYEWNGKTEYWSRVWNFVPQNGSNYTWFVVGHPAGKIANDPLCEVGCPYAVRGFDYDYVGILWLNDFFWDGNRLKVNPEAVKESGIKSLTTAANIEQRKGKPGIAMAELQLRVARAYRILFTRALKGVYVWIPDFQTWRFMDNSIYKNSC